MLRNLSCQTVLIQWLLIGGSPAFAEPPPTLSLAEMIPETVMLWETDRGVESRTYLGPDGELFKFRMAYPLEGGKISEYDEWRNQHGQVTQVLSSSVYITASPNDCSFTVGECTFFILLSSGQNSTVHYSGTYSPDGIWRVSLRPESAGFEVFARKYCAIVDRFGIALAYYVEDHNGDIRWARRVNGPDVAESKNALERVTAHCLQDIPLS